MPVSGKLFIGTRQVATGHCFHAVNPSTGEALEPVINTAGLPGVEQACELAWSAFHEYRRLDPEVGRMSGSCSAPLTFARVQG